MTAIADCHFPTELITNYSFAAAFSSAFAPIRFTFIIGANLIFIPAISLLSEDDNPSFLPESGKYIVSGWVKEIHAQQVTTYNSYFTVKVENVTNPVNINFYAKNQTPMLVGILLLEFLLFIFYYLKLQS